MAIGQVRFATPVLTEKGKKNGHSLHLPISFVRKQPNITMSKVCAPATFARGATTTCTIAFTDTTFTNAYVNFVDVLPKELKMVTGSVTGGQANGNSVTFKGTLAGAQPPDVAVTAGGSPGGGYLPLSAFSITPVAGVGDETIANFNVPAFTYGGQTYTRIGVVSNGYVVVGGGTGGYVQFVNQNLPDPTPPNNVLAPFWTDFNPGAGGAVRVGTLTDGVSTWIVVDYAAVKEYSTAKTDTFEIWIGTNGVQDISYVFGTIQGNSDGGFLTVGAENSFGNRGSNYYFNSTGTLPTSATQLVVTSVAGVPGETHTVTYQAKGQDRGKWVNYAQLTSNLFQGTNFVPFPGEVTR